MLRRTWLLVVVVLMLPARVHAQGTLQRVRHNKSSPAPAPSSNSSSNDRDWF